MGSALRLGLSDVPETMLWTLYGRASEAMRDDSSYVDSEAVRIFESIDYDFRRSFGPANPLLAMRAQTFDQSLRTFLERCPGGFIVNLGEGLETQRFRVRAPDSQWLTVDLPEGIRAREHFIAPDARHCHRAVSVTDTRWFDHVPSDKPVYISAQGLLMYLRGSEVRGLLRAISARFAEFHLVFDAIPPWLARASVFHRGLPLTLHYRTPPMPWGLSRYAARSRLRKWMGSNIHVSHQAYELPSRGLFRAAARLAPQLPGAGLWTPMVVTATRYAS